MTRYRVVHRTAYHYGASVAQGQTIAHLLPRETPNQQLRQADLTLDEPPDHRADYLDGFGNPTTYLSIEHPHDRLTLIATSEVDVDVLQIPETANESWQNAATDTFNGVLDLDAARYRDASPLVEPGSSFDLYARPSFRAGASLREVLAHLCHRIYEDFTFDATFSDVSTPIADVFASRRGVCQDFAHLALGCVRAMGLPGRYVSGYLETFPPPGQPKLQGADASHAWCSVRAPDGMWIDLDPTNDQLPPTHHVTVAWGRDYGDVAPVRGVVFGPPAEQELTVGVDVARIEVN